ncbi:MAG: phosphate signaling complex protein PhoU [Armatimonadota bacterium]
MRRIRETFEGQIEQVQVDVTRLASFVVEMLADAMRALVEQDEALADKVIMDDDVADELDLHIEQECMRLLALQQPMAKDLRIIGTAMKVIADLERVGDYAVDIARSAKTLADEPYFKALVDIPRMGDITISMVRTAAEAFVKQDLELVRQVVERDDDVDRLWYHLLDELVEYMRNDPELILQATHLLLVARYLERCADHVVNVAERVSYMETGRFEDLALSHTPGYERPEIGSGQESEQQPE